MDGFFCYFTVYDGFIKVFVRGVTIMEKVSNDFFIKHPQMSDAEEVTDLVALCDTEEIGEPDISLGDTLDLWNSIPLETDAWVALSPEGNQIIGYGFLEVTGKNRMDCCVFVHPQHKGRGVGSLILEKIEERAVKLAHAREGRHRLMNQVPFTNIKARNLLEKRDYQFTRLYERMKIVLQEEPQTHGVSLATNITIRPFQPNQDERTIFQVYDETFRDSWGYTEKDFTTWIQQKKGEQYDPKLWFIVWEDSTPVGFLMSRMQEDGLFIDLLGVRSQWRKQGIAQSLLLHTFNEAYIRGQNTVLLYVDSDSLTNAHRVYKQVGMKPDSQTALYAKELL
jgi:mycothiol synthase